jgi:hypothetical protein
MPSGRYSDCLPSPQGKLESIDVNTDYVWILFVMCVGLTGMQFLLISGNHSLLLQY